MRAAVWAERHGRGAPFAHHAFRRAVADGAALAELAVLADVAASVGLPPDELAAAIADPAIKHELRARTDAALALGVRGVPTLRIGGALLYGDDRLDDAAADRR